MSKSANQKRRILYLMRLLWEKTDENHSLTMPQLIQELENYSIHTERKTLYDDLETLRVFGMDILMRREKPAGYYLAGREFELPELKLLVDAVQSSRFITAKKSMELIKKLESLTSRYEAGKLRRQVFVSNRVKTMNESIFYNVDRLHQAILENSEIRFGYFEWTVNREMRLKRNGQKYQISPWALTWDNENYYVIGYEKETGMVKHYRVDKMVSIELAGTKREGKEVFSRFDAAGFSKKTFGMFGGEEKELKLRFSDRMIGVVIDRFGKDIPIRQVEEGYFQTRLSVIVSRPFFGWLTGLGTDTEILSPEDVRRKYREYLKEIERKYEDDEPDR